MGIQPRGAQPCFLLQQLPCQTLHCANRTVLCLFQATPRSLSAVEHLQLLYSAALNRLDAPLLPVTDQPAAAGGVNEVHTAMEPQLAAIIPDHESMHLQELNELLALLDEEMVPTARDAASVAHGDQGQQEGARDQQQAPVERGCIGDPAPTGVRDCLFPQSLNTVLKSESEAHFFPDIHSTAVCHRSPHRFYG